MIASRIKDIVKMRIDVFRTLHGAWNRLLYVLFIALSQALRIAPST